MHELAVTQSILSIAQKHALQAQASRVTDIYIVMGKLSSIVDDSIQFYWDMISEDTLCVGARLHFDRIPAKMICLSCGNNYSLDEGLTPCPQCNSPQVKVISGEEFWVDSIEIVKQEF